MLNFSSKIYIAGHRGLVGSAIWNNLMAKGYTNLVGRTHSELDLCRQADVSESTYYNIRRKRGMPDGADPYERGREKSP